MVLRAFRLLTAALTASIATQGPSFAVQYQHQVAGRLLQVKRDLASLFDAAASENLPPATYLDQAEREAAASSLPLIAGLRESLGDLEDLEAAFQSLEATSELAKPLLLFRHADLLTLKTTAAHYVPAVPLSLAGWAYGIAGGLIGLLLYSLVMRAFRRGAMSPNVP